MSITNQTTRDEPYVQIEYSIKTPVCCENDLYPACGEQDAAKTQWLSLLGYVLWPHKGAIPRHVATRTTTATTTAVATTTR